MLQQDVSIVNMGTPRVTSRQFLWELLNRSQDCTRSVYLSDIGAQASMLCRTPLLESLWSKVEDVESMFASLQQIQQIIDALDLGLYSFSIEQDIYTGHYDDSDLWRYLCFPKVIEHPASVEQSIYARYCNVEQVQTIYVQRLPKMYKVFVILGQDHYEDELMDHLLDREAEILDLHPDELFHFHYLPLLEDDYPRPVPKSAVLIFSR
jgi:hypothetical protein